MDHAIDMTKDNLKIDDLAPPLAKLALSIGGVGLIAAAVMGIFDGEAFFRGYIMNFAFVMSIALGALFFVVLQHLTRAGWSVTVRRLPEHMVAAFPIMFVLFLPILVMMWLGWLGMSDAMVRTYPWLDHQAIDAGAHTDSAMHTLHIKRPYLNMGFFTIRILLYFGLWIWIAIYFRGGSLEQDRTGDASITTRMQGRAAPCMLAFALTTTFFAFDILMSLNPLWFSTIFGVYYFAGTAVCFFSVLTIAFMLLQGSGRLTQAITVEHFHDLGKLIFAFTVFWAYIGFSQYMLIWYANLPEETHFYVPRQQGIWLWLMFILLFGHFVVPFFAIISRNVKRQPQLLFAAAVWMVLMHWLDMAFLVLPHTESVSATTHVLVASSLTATQVIQSVLCLVGIGGVFIWAVLSRIGDESLVPLRDPRLSEALAFENV
ncbi:MAG: quinol:cytochrome C oxidoreductase [Phycisphaerae bacterium]